VSETERNLNNKISRGGFTAAFMLQCFEAIGASSVRFDKLPQCGLSHSDKPAEAVTGKIAP
jgi:hypothetical protein